MKNKSLIQAAKCELSKREFWTYCKTKAPDFYKSDRTFLHNFCDDLQQFIEPTDQHDILVVNMPPRHGKSRTIGNFVEWVLGNDQTQKIMTGSYNETLSTNFSKGVRNTIQEIKADKNKIVYSDIFPGVNIKRGDGAMNMWSLENGYNNYLATSPTGTATGFGATIMIIDDLIKSALEANNADTLEKQWTWFTDTMLSRLEEGGKIIIVMTRWHSLDLAGRIIEQYGDKVKVVQYKAVQEDGSMLCPEILSKESYETKIQAMGVEIAEANYQQNPIDIKGRLYQSFKTYTELPKDAAGRPVYSAVKNYTDTADTGDDYLCSIDYVEYNHEAYVINVIYTKDGMEITEPAVAKMLYEDQVNDADIESNNGGRGFARNVESILRNTYHSNRTIINPFFQSKNKISRILSNSTWVMNHIYFPVNWMDRFPEYYKAMSRYQKEGKNAHDDAPDATTGIAEKINKGQTFSFD
ncbi:phage terminase large subunit [Longicatena sp. 210702-DFI.1.36]|uniref:phage terminase large subunit n=1 Tax=Bacillota TaxID=1239 RepID=UPI001D07D700|nr:MULTISPECIES: phage terminase large subunit [Longicatena]MCB6265522.1 phage terminase large subunit [Longicatena sp. 210702-DFI.1.160]MCB6316325.1 phage terminase large subunit [Longicatena sp. 210702-DFI.1.100]MCB6430114.1 phage terminase large subunit [Longicatena sp. 210702-DFI.1.36]MCB6432995.1 phage terminase large subunit [Longicatena sp. 210702-DFI.1.249]MCB6439714.1 phage terminase large subunit [Longicatena sp. 210702-DFI.1.255]